MSMLTHLEPGDRVIECLLMIVLGVVVISSSAWLTARGLKRSAALRHLVLLCALVCCLACPVAACFCTLTGWTIIAVPLGGTEQARTASAAPTPHSQSTTDLTRRVGSSPPVESRSLPAQERIATIATNASSATGSQGHAAADPPAPAAPPVPSVSLSWREVAAGALLLWGLGTILILARLVRNYWRIVHLRRASHAPASNRIETLLRQAADQIGTQKLPLLLVSDRTIAPLAVGLARPAIILPHRLLEQMSDEALRDVLIHETAHLRRGDQRIALLQELAAMLYWPILSVHALNRELRRAREEVCDNVVLAARDPVAYGQTLLHVAEVLVGARSMRVAVGIVSSRGELERRITRLVDPKRSTATQLSRKVACIVMLTFLMVGVIASATHFAIAASPKSASRLSATQETSSDAAQAQKPPSDAELQRTIILHGKVIGPDDRPIAAARLYLTADPWGDPIELGASKPDGSYRLEVVEKSFHHYVDDSVARDVCASLIAVADGFGAAWVRLSTVERDGWPRVKDEYAHDLKLTADLPIQGRVVDADGKPLAGAQVDVECIFELSAPDLGPMLNAIKAGTPAALEEKDYVSWKCPLNRKSWRMIPTAVSDSDGRFQIAGVGRDRAVKLRLTGPGMRSTDFSVLTREGVDEFTAALRDKNPHTRQPDGYFYPARTTQPVEKHGAMIFGPSPTIAVDPARTVAGTVRDARTGKPMADVRVVAGWMDQRTDRNGRYRLMRADDSSTLWIQAQPDTAQNLICYKQIEGVKDLGEIVVDFDLPRGVNISGRVLEAGTEKPIVSAPISTCHAPWPGPLRAGWVKYYPLANNPIRGTDIGRFFQADGVSNWETSAVIDENGRFQVAVPPGPGVMLVLASAGGGSMEFTMFGNFKESDGVHLRFPYVSLTTRSKDDGVPEGDSQTFPGFNRPISLEGSEAYRVINPPADATSLDLTLHVTRAPTRILRIVDPEGRAISGAKVQGLSATPMTVVLDDSEAEVTGLDPHKPRQVIAFGGDDKYAGRTFILGGDSQPVTLKLEPAAAVTGRIIDGNGIPMKALLSPIAAPIFTTPDEVGMITQTRTDEKGRFRIAPLLPGQRYFAEIRGGAYNTDQLGKAFENVLLRSGEVRDLGDIRVKPKATN